MFLIFLHSEDNKSLLFWRYVMTSMVFVFFYIENNKFLLLWRHVITH